MPNQLPVVSILTELGLIEVELASEKAPGTAANFLRYVEEGFYNGASFYRTVKLSNQPDNEVKIEVIQGGLGMDHLSGKAKYPPIKQETTRQTGLLHFNGTISMARLEPDGATSEFFICIGDQFELDFGGKRNPDGQGFAAFGQVLKGMEVAQKIQLSPSEGQNLVPPIQILNIKRVSL